MRQFAAGQPSSWLPGGTGNSRGAEEDLSARRHRRVGSGTGSHLSSLDRRARRLARARARCRRAVPPAASPPPGPAPGVMRTCRYGFPAPASVRRAAGRPAWEPGPGRPAPHEGQRGGQRSPPSKTRRSATRGTRSTRFSSGPDSLRELAARIPQVRAELGVGPGVLGLVLLSAAVGSVLGTSLSGLLIGWMGDLHRDVDGVDRGRRHGGGGGWLAGPGRHSRVAAGGCCCFGNGARDVAMTCRVPGWSARCAGRSCLGFTPAGVSARWRGQARRGDGRSPCAGPVHLIAAALLIAGPRPRRHAASSQRPHRGPSGPRPARSGSPGVARSPPGTTRERP